MVENHATLLENFINKLETDEDELKFYKRAANFHYWAWNITAGIVFLSSVISALFAALMSEENFKSFGKIALFIIPILGATASGLLHLYKFREKEALREEGRIEIEDIIACAKSLMASANGDEEKLKDAFHSVRERYKIFTLSQHRRDVALRDDEIPKVKTN
jgi:hypothetical protein